MCGCLDAWEVGEADDVPAVAITALSKSLLSHNRHHMSGTYLEHAPCCTAEEVGEADDVPAATITALFEALSYAHLLEDAGVMSALVKTLLHLHQWCVGK